MGRAADWLAAEFDWSEQQAANHIGIYNLARENPAHVRDFTKLSLGTAYVLAAARMRPETAHKFIRIAECERFDVGSANVLPSSMDALLRLGELPRRRQGL